MNLVIFKRGLAFSIDIAVAAIILLVFDIIPIFKPYSFWLGAIYLGVFRDLFFIYGSLGKRIIGIKLVNNKNESLDVLNKIIRNFTIIIWPIEGIIIIIFGRRIGDFLSKSDVITKK